MKNRFQALIRIPVPPKGGPHTSTKYNRKVKHKNAEPKEEV
jgi:hypothetical protein